MKGALPGGHLVEHAAQGEDVGEVIDRLAAHLLGRHVAHRAEDRPGHGAAHRRRGADVGPESLGSRPREAEIEDLQPPVAGEEEVLGLEVAVHDAPLVRRGEAARDVDAEVDDLAHRQPAATQPLAQRLALQELHDRVRLAALVAEVMDREDVGMRQRRPPPWPRARNEPGRPDLRPGARAGP